MKNPEVEDKHIHFGTIRKLPFAIAILDTDNKLVEISELWRHIFNVRDAQVSGKDFFEIHPVFKDHWRSILRDVMHGTVRRSLEEQLNYPDGRTQWIRWTASPWQEDTNVQSGVIIYCEDVTLRKNENERIKTRHSIESLLIEISDIFAASAVDGMDDLINFTIKKLGEFCKVDRSYVFFYDKEKKTISNTHEWCAQGISEQKDNLQKIPVEMLPNWLEQLQMLKPIYLHDIGLLGDEWELEKQSWLEQEIQTILSVPLKYKGELIGFAGFDSVQTKRKWKESEVMLLQVFADRVTTLLEKMRAEQALKANNEELEGIFKGIPDLIFKLDRNGRILGFRAGSNAKLNTDPKNFIRKKVDEVVPQSVAKKIVRSIDKVLTSNMSSMVEYPLEIDGVTNYFEAYINPINEDQVIAVIRDISHRKNTELMLQTNRELLAQTGKMAKVGGWEIDMKTYESKWTDEMFKIYGLEVDNQLSPEERIRFYHPDDRLKLKQAWEKAELMGESFDLELRLNAADKTKKWVHSIGQAKWQGKDIVKIYGTMQDITLQKQAELLAKQTTRELESFFNVSLDLFFIADMQGNLLKCNNAWSENLGYSKKQLKNRKFLEFVHSEDMQATLETLSQLIDHMKILNFVNRFKAVDGSYRFMEWRAQAHGDLIYAAARDITERRMAEDDLIKEKQRLEGIIAATNIGTWEWNIQTNRIEYNERWAEILGYTIEELQPITMDTFRKLAHPDDTYKSNELIEKCFRKEIDYYEYECRMIHKNGDIIWVSDRGKVVSWTPDGEPLLMLGTHADITARKKNEQERIATLNIISDQNKRLLNFTHIVSHNLRSHSGNFAMLLDLLRTEPTESGRKEVLDMLKSASDQLTETVNNLNEVVAVNTNVNERKYPVNLHYAIEKTKNNIQALIWENNVSIVNNVPESIAVNVVPAYLESILLNLFTNGIKYRAPGRAPVITFSCRKNGDYLELLVSDNGMGIDMERHGDKIFGMYKTFHGNKDARGIGLFISKNQMEAMGGNITVESKVGVGTTFKLQFYEPVV